MDAQLKKETQIDECTVLIIEECTYKRKIEIWWMQQFKNENES